MTPKDEAVLRRVYATAKMLYRLVEDNLTGPPSTDLLDRIDEVLEFVEARVDGLVVPDPEDAAAQIRAALEGAGYTLVDLDAVPLPETVH